MQTNLQEQTRLEAALQASAQLQTMRLIAACRQRQGDDSIRRVWHRSVETAASLAIALTMTTCAIYMVTVWMGW